VQPGEERWSRSVAAEAERLVAWLRLPVIGLFVLARTLPHPNPEAEGFYVTLAVFSVWSVGALVLLSRRQTGRRFAVFATFLDIAFFTALSVLSGGPFSNARFAYVLIPVVVAFRFRPSFTALAAGASVAAYVAQSLAHPAGRGAGADRFILTFAGFLAWVGVACVLLSALLARRTGAIAELLETRTRLLGEIQTAEERERRRLAEALHDHAVQNLLSARHDLQELGGSVHGQAALARAEHAVTQTLGDLRETIFELHPYVLDEVGLAPAILATAERAAGRTGMTLDLALQQEVSTPFDDVLYSAARELISNAERHSGASHLFVELREDGAQILLAVEDDGRGIELARLGARVADGHIGLASQRARIESSGGSMDIVARPGQGTRVEVRLLA
jgi:two-component system, NarL family, sensor kinase